MFGKEHLEWTEKQAVSEKIDGFLAGLLPEERVYALAILRERHTVYKDEAPFRAALSQSLQNAAALRNVQWPRYSSGPLGSVLSGAFGL